MKLIQDYANGIEDSPVSEDARPPIKGIGNSTTIPFDQSIDDIRMKYEPKSVVRSIFINSGLSPKIYGVNSNFSNHWWRYRRLQDDDVKAIMMLPDNNLEYSKEVRNRTAKHSTRQELKTQQPVIYDL